MSPGKPLPPDHDAPAGYDPRLLRGPRPLQVLTPALLSAGCFSVLAGVLVVAMRPYLAFALFCLGVILLVCGYLGACTLLRHLRAVHGLALAVLDQCEQPIYVKDRRGRYLVVGRAAARLWKQQASAVVGAVDADFRTPDAANREREQDEQCLREGGTVHDCEVRCVLDGEERMLLIDKSPLRDTDGRILGLVGIGRDVTERQREHALIAQREEEYRALFENNPLPVFVYAADTLELLDVNAAMCAVWGYSREELLTLSVQDLVTDEEGERLRQHMLAHSPLPPAVAASAWQARTADGRVLPVEVNSGAIERGGRAARLVIVRDIADRQRQIAALEASGKRYRALVETAPGMIWTHDLDGVTLMVNDAFSEALGYTGEEVIGRNLIDLVPESGRETLSTHLRRVREDGHDAGMVHVLTRAGELRVWQYRTRLCEDEGGRPYVLGAAQDITLRHQYEQRLRERSMRDALTRCYNRHYLDTFAARAQSDQVWACVIADIDYFKKYNDAFGHQRGDEVLVQLAGFLTRNAREDDAVVRLGGDEFLLLMLSADARQAQYMVARLKKRAAEELEPTQFTLGWAVREDGESVQETIDRADRALLEARAMERGPVLSASFTAAAARPTSS